MRAQARCLFFLLCLAPRFAHSTAGAIAIDLSTYNAATSSTTGVWNAAAQALHVPLVIDRSGGTVSGEEDEALNIGTGSDGPFNAGTAVTFDVNSGATPNLYTLDTSRTYQFTTFTLPTGATLAGTGTSPLTIRVQGDAQIDGTIDLRGGVGGVTISPATNTANGGSSCCGGGAGGSGASAVQTFSTQGTNPAAPVLGGQPGTISALGGTDGGGGGGGGNRYAGSAGAVGGAASGAAGPSYGDQTLVTLYGGAGGGGSGGNSNVGTGGAGGGGGGGAVSIQVGGNFTISSTGQILTTGGAGGALANAGHKAGGGGGGGGGSVLIYAGGTGVDNGSIDSTGGLGGTAFVAGGDGGGGVNRFAFAAGEFTGTGSENPPPSILPKPKTVYSTAQYTIVSNVYDTQSSHAHYTGLTKVQSLNSGDSITYYLAGSTDGFVNSDTGWVTEGNLGQLDGKRYFRFKVVLKSGSASSTPRVTGLSVNYKNLFEFSLTGCAKVSPPSKGTPTPWGWAVLVSYLIAIAVWVRRSRAKR